MRKPSATRLPIAFTARAAVEPDPSPTIMPSVTCAAADSAAASFNWFSSWLMSHSEFTFPAGLLSSRVWRVNCQFRRMREKREPELIAAGKRGDQAAIAELFERHYASSLCVARRILRSEEESQDAVQSAYLSAFRHLHRFR